MGARKWRRAAPGCGGGAWPDGDGGGGGTGRVEHGEPGGGVGEEGRGGAAPRAEPDVAHVGDVGRSTSARPRRQGEGVDVGRFAEEVSKPLLFIVHLE